MENKDGTRPSYTRSSTYATSNYIGVLNTTSSVYSDIRSRMLKKEKLMNKTVDMKLPSGRHLKQTSVPLKDMDISLDGFPANNCFEHKNHLCQTESEYKAQKLNRTEESKLENYKLRVQRERRLTEKHWTQTTYTFRAQSARILNRPTTKQKHKMDAESNKSIKKRPKSSPAYVSLFQQRPKEPEEDKGMSMPCQKAKPCKTCEYMRKVIEIYKEHTSVLNLDYDELENHEQSKYMFSDRQVKTFMNLLETDFCSEIPALAEILHEGDLVFGAPPDSYGGSNHHLCARHDNSIQNRIRKFCQSQENFNRKHPLPEEIKRGMENVRIAQAILAKRQHVQNRRAMITQEARRKLGIVRL